MFVIHFCYSGRLAVNTLKHAAKVNHIMRDTKEKRERQRKAWIEAERSINGETEKERYKGKRNDAGNRD